METVYILIVVVFTGVRSLVRTQKYILTMGYVLLCISSISIKLVLKGGKNVKGTGPESFLDSLFLSGHLARRGVECAGGHLPLHLSPRGKCREPGPQAAFWRRAAGRHLSPAPPVVGLMAACQASKYVVSSRTHPDVQGRQPPRPGRQSLLTSVSGGQGHFGGFSETLACWSPQLGTCCHPSSVSLMFLSGTFHLP